jgi:hypothetical protein
MIRLHNQNRTHTFIDVESGQFISLPKDETDKPPVNADINGLQFYGKSTQDGEPSPDNPVDIINTPPEFNLTSCGKNLFNINNITYIEPDVNFAIIEDKVRLTANKTTTYMFVRDRVDKYFLQAGQPYTVNCKCQNSVIADGYVSLLINNVPRTDVKSSARLQWSDTNEKTIHLTFTPNTTGFYFIALYGYGEGAAIPQGAYIDFWDIQLLKGSYTAETLPSYTKYDGSTYPYRIEDLDGNLHELCSLPDGTRDEYDRDNGILIKRVKRLTILSGTAPFNWTYTDASSAADPTDTLCTASFYDTTIPINESFATNANVYCDIATPGFYTPIEPYLIWLNGRNVQLLVVMTLKKSELASLDNVGLREWITAHAPFDIYYALDEPQIIPIKRYGEIYDGQVWDKNEKPKSIQYHTNTFTDVGVEMQCEVRKLGNRKMSEFYWVTENGDYIVTDDNDYIMLEY